MYTDLFYSLKVTNDSIVIDLKIVRLHFDILHIVVLFCTSYYSETTSKKKKEHIKSLIKTTITSLPMIGLTAAVAVEIDNQLKLLAETYLIKAGDEVQRIRNFKDSLVINEYLLSHLSDIENHLSKIDNSFNIINNENELIQIGKIWKNNNG